MVTSQIKPHRIASCAQRKGDFAKPQAKGRKKEISHLGFLEALLGAPPSPDPPELDPAASPLFIPPNDRSGRQETPPAGEQASPPTAGSPGKPKCTRLVLRVRAPRSRFRGRGDGEEGGNGGGGQLCWPGLVWRSCCCRCSSCEGYKEREGEGDGAV